MRLSPHHLFLGLLVAGSAVNLAAGARRPSIERAILSRGYYPAADRAAAAIRSRVPAGAPLAVVGYDGDTLDQLDIEMWIDYRMKWLLYPRGFEQYRMDSSGVLRRRVSYKPQEAEYVPSGGPGAGTYALFFRASRPPELPDFARSPPPEVLARDPMFVLIRIL